ncbi:hypothetical protein JCM33374_g213 [Metschnikowia sp. JCM 33374]|nr:hypothetical protein JCM33374_g213 [Metschnikowia sp. JCM 33374]
MDGRVMPRSHSETRNSTIGSPRVKAQEIASRLLSSVDEVIDVINEQEKKNFKLGVLLLLIAIFTWIIGLELVNTVLKGDAFQKPFFLAVLTGSCFILNFIPNVISFFNYLSKKPSNSFPNSSPLLSTSDLEIDNGTVLKSSSRPDPVVKTRQESRFLNRSEILVLAFQIAVIYFFYNLMALSALQYTSASNQTILGSTTTFFTLCLGVILKIDRFSIKKLACVTSSLMGVILINLGGKDLEGGSDNKFKPKNPLYGNFLALIGAFFYAVYLLNMKIKCGTGEKSTNERELFGWVGVFTLILGLPVLFIAHLFGIEKFELPSDVSIFVMISINALFSVTSDYVTILAMLLTSPLVTSLALTSCIPITIFVDFIILDFSKERNGSSASKLFIYGFGVVCILVSVILININITSENELIEEVIEDTLEVAIHDDEVLSPMLSPYLSFSSAHAGLRHDVGIRSPLSPKVSVWKRKPLTKLSRLNNEVSRFTLNHNSEDTPEDTPLNNSHHSQRLYTNDNLMLAEESGEEENTNIFLSGGVNHKFSLEHVSQTID